jgi:hypothetical protein
MSWEVVTVDGDPFSGGFFGADTSRIMLGELPAMSIDQFGEFAGDAMVGVLPHLSVKDRTEARNLIEAAKRKIDGRPVRTVENPYADASSADAMAADWDRSERTGDKVGASLASEGIMKAVGADLGNISTHYSENPFIVRDTTVIIGGTYEVEQLEFMYFALNYLEGGGFGWDDELGVPATAAKAIAQVDLAFTGE